MPWVKLDDQIMRNPKIRAVSRDAFAFHIAGLAYCATALSDGHIPDRDLPLVAAEALAPEASAGELGAVGLWERREGGWEIHDYLDFQPSRADVLDERRKARERKAVQRARQKASHAVSPPGTDGVSHDGSPPPPVPSRPDPEIPTSISEVTQYGLDPGRLLDMLAQDQLDKYLAGGGQVSSRSGFLRAARERAEGEHAAKAMSTCQAFTVPDEAFLAEVLLGRRRLTIADRKAS